LLPVGNKPVISYTLDWLEKAGIYGKKNKKRKLFIRKKKREILILYVEAIVVGNAAQKLSAYLRGYTGNVHCTVANVDEDIGTAAALRTIKEKIDASI
jgi:translation initiation factor eIF-2B subunit gamma